MRSNEFPSTETNGETVLAAIAELQRRDVRWDEGRTWAFVYHADDEVLRVARAAYAMAAPSNALSTAAFPGIAEMQEDLVSMVGNLLGAPAPFGSVTSGGTESIFLAMKSARDRARVDKRTSRPNIVVPATAHPAFSKASHYLGLEVIPVPTLDDQRADANAMRESITDHTIAMVGSAPSYPHGVIDPITELADIAKENNLWFHVDACVGGFLLPFIRDLGNPLPAFDFSVDGVTSMSADFHKYGYSMKGASIVLYRNESDFHRQWYTLESWNGGVYETPSMGGTRPGGPIASAWAVLQLLGRPGYQRLTQRALNATRELTLAISKIPGFSIPIAPPATLFAIESDRYDIEDVARGMSDRSWVLGTQGPPPSIHLTVSPAHDEVVSLFVDDLDSVSSAIARGDESKGPDRVARYGS